MQPGNRSWDPGTVQKPIDERNKLFKINVSEHIYYLLSTAMVSAIDVSEENSENGSRTDLDSHANMPVVGRNAYIISDTGRIADVNAFTPDYDSMQISIVDAAVRYDCPYSGQMYVLVLRNSTICSFDEAQSNTSFRDERSGNKSERYTEDTIG
jgi:hypothetical protein